MSKDLDSIMKKHVTKAKKIVYKWVAMDSLGFINAFEKKPKLKKGIYYDYWGFEERCITSLCIGREKSEKIIKNWQNSLRKIER